MGQPHVAWKNYNHDAEINEKPILSQAELNINLKVRSNPFAWRGQFSPQLIESLLNAYAKRGSIILDPFVGSGTVLLESGRKELKAFGYEINPAAFIISKTYKFINFTQNQRLSVLNSIQIDIENMTNDLPLFLNEQSIPDLQQNLLDYLSNIKKPYVRCLIETLIILLDFFRGPVAPKKLLSTWLNLRRTVEGLPYSSEKIGVSLGDARSINLENTVDVIITSPPYINVFNYHQMYRASTEALGWNLLSIAKSEIGSNRQNRGNRFLTVIQYCLDMAMVLNKLNSACHKNSRLILVIGRESNVCKTPFYNTDILLKLATGCAGFELVLKQQREFQNRFGQTIIEDILHFKKARDLTNQTSLLQVREIALGALKEALNRVPKDNQSLLEEAIESSNYVNPSAMFKARQESVIQ